MSIFQKNRHKLNKDDFKYQIQSFSSEVLLKTLQKYKTNGLPIGFSIISVEECSVLPSVGLATQLLAGNLVGLYGIDSKDWPRVIQGEMKSTQDSVAYVLFGRVEISSTGGNHDVIFCVVGEKEEEPETVFFSAQNMMDRMEVSSEKIKEMFSWVEFP